MCKIIRQKRNIFTNYLSEKLSSWGSESSTWTQSWLCLCILKAPVADTEQVMITFSYNWTSSLRWFALNVELRKKVIPGLSSAGKAQSPMKLLFLGLNLPPIPASVSKYLYGGSIHKLPGQKNPHTKTFLSNSHSWILCSVPSCSPEGSVLRHSCYGNPSTLVFSLCSGINNSYEIIYSGFQKTENRLLRETTFLDSKPSHLSTNAVLQGPAEDQTFTFWGKNNRKLISMDELENQYAISNLLWNVSSAQPFFFS